MSSVDYLYGKLSALRPFHRTWSLAELRAGESVYREMIEWAGKLGDYEFDVLSNEAPVKAGALLLWLHSEVTRRHGHEGQLWRVLSNRQYVPWREQTWGRLYNASGNIQTSHGRLLESAARILGLRHAFDVEDAHKWFRLIHLQFGFTHEDAKCRLQAWLSGQVLPVAVQTLLEERDQGAHEFQLMWRKLRQFRLGNLSRRNMEDHLKTCCWVLPEWSADLINAALASTPVFATDNAEDEETESFFTPPRLHWDGAGQPCFKTEICHLDTLEEKADAELRSGSRILARLIHQPGGGFVPDVEGELVICEGVAARSHVELRLVASDGSLLRHGNVTLWHADSDISLFRPSDGYLVKESQLRSGQAFDAITPGDVTLYPAAAISSEIGNGYRLHRFLSGWSGVIEARLDDLKVWTSAGFGAQPVPLPTEAISVRWGSMLDFGDECPTWPWLISVSLRIHDSAWSFAGMRWTRADGRTMLYRGWPDTLSLVEGDIARPVTLRVILKHSSGRVCTVPVSLPPPVRGCLRWSENGKTQVQQGARTLLARDARQSLWSFFLPEIRDEYGVPHPAEPRQCSLMEGDVVRANLRSRASTLPPLGGYGAPAWISSDPYNSTTILMKVASRVVDGGVIGNVRVNPAEGKVSVQSFGSFELGADHQVLVWLALPDSPAAIILVDHELLQATDSGWEFPFLVGSSLIGLAFLYAGERLGSWFDGMRWSDALLKDEPANVAKMAALLRVWKAPLLQSEGDVNHLRKVKSWFAGAWKQILPCWMVANGKLIGPGNEEWRVRYLDDDWKLVLQTILTGVQPQINAEEVDDFVAAISSACSSQRLDDLVGYAILDLAEICPLLAVRTMRAALSGTMRNRLHKQGQSLVQQMRSIFQATDAIADELAIRHGNRDGNWLRTSIPSLYDLDRGTQVLPLNYRRLSSGPEFRRFAFGVWLEEIRRHLHL